MEATLEYILINSRKAEMVAYISERPDKFDELLQLSLSNKPYSWKACWLLSACMVDNEPFLRPYIENFIELLPKVGESQQRIILQILQRMTIYGEKANILFDICTSIWKNNKAAGALKYNAFKMIVKIANSAPYLMQEIKIMLEPQYTGNLSDGIRHSISIYLKRHSFIKFV
jgi:hypothetical protein